MLGVDLLAPGPFQPRVDMDEGRLNELADSIRSRGVLQPILVRPDPDQKGRYQIIAGERRWRASQRAGLHEVPVHVRLLDDADAMAAALVENLQRADLNAIEEAEGLQRLLTDYALTQEELAGAVGKSRPHIGNILRLLNLPEAVRQKVRDGLLSAGHARALLAHPDPCAAADIVIARGSMCVRQKLWPVRHPEPSRRRSSRLVTMSWSVWSGIWLRASGSRSRLSSTARAVHCVWIIAALISSIRSCGCFPRKTE